MITSDDGESSSAEEVISAYYNSLSNEEKSEQEAWREFAVAQLKRWPDPG